MMTDNENTEPMNWKTTKRQKRLAKHLLSLWDLPDMTALQQFILEKMIKENIPLERQQEILSTPTAEQGKDCSTNDESALPLREPRTVRRAGQRKS